jgi:DNA-binding NarL/FixJ family response regulator
MHDAGPFLAKMRSVGVNGYLLKSDAPKGLPLAINSLLRDQPFFGVSGTDQLRLEKT